MEGIKFSQESIQSLQILSCSGVKDLINVVAAFQCISCHQQYEKINPMLTHVQKEHASMDFSRGKKETSNQSASSAGISCDVTIAKKSNRDNGTINVNLTQKRGTKRSVSSKKVRTIESKTDENMMDKVLGTTNKPNTRSMTVLKSESKQSILKLLKNIDKKDETETGEKPISLREKHEHVASANTVSKANPNNVKLLFESSIKGNTKSGHESEGDQTKRRRTKSQSFELKSNRSLEKEISLFDKNQDNRSSHDVESQPVDQTSNHDSVPDNTSETPAKSQQFPHICEMLLDKNVIGSITPLHPDMQHVGNDVITQNDHLVTDDVTAQNKQNHVVTIDVMHHNKEKWMVINDVTPQNKHDVVKHEVTCQNKGNRVGHGTEEEGTKMRTCAYCDELFPNTDAIFQHYAKIHNDSIQQQISKQRLKRPPVNGPEADQSDLPENTRASRTISVNLMKLNQFFDIDNSGLSDTKIINITPIGNTRISNSLDLDMTSAGVTAALSKVTSCPLCHVVLKGGNYVRHVLLKHYWCRIKNENAGKRETKKEEHVVCETCGNKFKYKRNLDLHMKFVHQGVTRQSETPYANRKLLSCGSCDFTTREARRLRAHVQSVHMGLEPFRCKHCDFTTRERTALRYHTYRHLKEKPYSCRHCSHACIQKSSMKAHLKKIHGIVLEALLPAGKGSSPEARANRARVLAEHEKHMLVKLVKGCSTSEENEYYDLPKNTSPGLKDNDDGSISEVSDNMGPGRKKRKRGKGAKMMTSSMKQAEASLKQEIFKASKVSQYPSIVHSQSVAGTHSSNNDLIRENKLNMNAEQSLMEVAVKSQEFFNPIKQGNNNNLVFSSPANTVLATQMRGINALSTSSQMSTGLTQLNIVPSPSKSPPGPSVKVWNVSQTSTAQSGTQIDSLASPHTITPLSNVIATQSGVLNSSAARNNQLNNAIPTQPRVVNSSPGISLDSIVLAQLAGSTTQTNSSDDPLAALTDDPGSLLCTTLENFMNQLPGDVTGSECPTPGGATEGTSGTSGGKALGKHGSGNIAMGFSDNELKLPIPGRSVPGKVMDSKGNSGVTLGGLCDNALQLASSSVDVSSVAGKAMDKQVSDAIAMGLSNETGLQLAISAGTNSSNAALLDQSQLIIRSFENNDNTAIVGTNNNLFDGFQIPTKPVSQMKVRAAPKTSYLRNAMNEKPLTYLSTARLSTTQTMNNPNKNIEMSTNENLPTICDVMSSSAQQQLIMTSQFDFDQSYSNVFNPVYISPSAGKPQIKVTSNPLLDPQIPVLLSQQEGFEFSNPDLMNANASSSYE